MELIKRILFVVVLVGNNVVVHGYSLLDPRPVSQLLELHEATIMKLKYETSKVVPSMEVEPYKNDVFFLRYCLVAPPKKSSASSGSTTRTSNNGGALSFEDEEYVITLLKRNLEWRLLPNNREFFGSGINGGKFICDIAVQALTMAQFNAATSGGAPGGGAPRWNNEPIQRAAVAVVNNKSILAQLLTLEQAITTVNEYGDLVYCISPGKIDEIALMSTLTINEMVNYFLYIKEIQSIVCNQKSVQNNRLCAVITVNDFSAYKLIGGSSSSTSHNNKRDVNAPAPSASQRSSSLKNLRTALSKSTKIANELYPKLVGPSIIYNLPTLVYALIEVFIPIFPLYIRQNLKFQQWKTLRDSSSFTDLAHGGKYRYEFLNQLNTVLTTTGTTTTTAGTDESTKKWYQRGLS